MNLKIISIIFLGLVQLSLCLSWMYSSLDKELEKPLYWAGEETIEFEVERGDSLKKIARKLKEDGIISSELLFNFYVKEAEKADKLQAGRYIFSKGVSTAKLADSMIFGDIFIEKVRLLVPEGFNLREIDEAITLTDAEISGKVSSFKASDFKGDYNFLSDVPDNKSLEGFLFPDTYDYKKEGLKTEIIIEKMLDNFDKKLDSSLKREIERQGKNIFEIVIMASILEKELRTKDDMKTVAGLLYKRIESGMPLQVDASVVYALGRNNLSREDLRADSPYNTYLYRGLPKGPISNPGIKAIEAAIYPEGSPYWYYISKPTGETVFSKDFIEHQQAINKYLR